MLSSVVWRASQIPKVNQALATLTLKNVHERRALKQHSVVDGVSRQEAAVSNVVYLSPDHFGGPQLTEQEGSQLPLIRPRRSLPRLLQMPPLEPVPTDVTLCLELVDRCRQEEAE
jgi:hypothetical protein